MLQGRAKVLVVTKDAGGLLFGDGASFLARRRRAGAVDHSTAERGDVDVAVADLNDDSVAHGIKNVPREGLRVSVGEDKRVCGRIAISSTDKVCLLFW